MNNRISPLRPDDEAISADFTPCGHRMELPLMTYVCDRPLGHDDTLGHRDHGTYFFGEQS